MLCKNCGCGIPDGVMACRICGCTEKVAYQPVPQMNPAFSRAVVTPVQKRFCVRCGRELVPGAKFCNGCGTHVAPSAPMPRPVAAPAPMPRPVAVPASMPRPVAAPAPMPRSVAVPAPMPRPVAAPVPTPRPVAAPVPVSMPVAAPIPTPVHAEKETVPWGVVAAPMADSPVQPKICPSCGKELKPEALFCNVCGAKADGSYVPAVSKAEEVSVAPAPGGDPQPASVPENEGTVTEVAAPVKKSHKGLIIGVIVAAAVAIIGVAAWLCLVDPFEWFGNDQKEETSQNDSDMTSEELALEYVDLAMQNDAAGAVALIHGDIFAAGIVNMGYDASDKQAYIDDLAKDLTAQNAVYGEDYTYTVAEPVSAFYGEKQTLIDTLEATYDIEVEDVATYGIQVTITTKDNAEHKKEAAVNLVKVDGQWFVRDVPWIVG